MSLEIASWECIRGISKMPGEVRGGRNGKLLFVPEAQ